MNVCVVAFAATLVTSLGVGSELPADQGFQGVPVSVQERSFEDEGTPVWERLADLSRFEKINAEIALDHEGKLARQIESLWNSGRFDEALDLFPALAPLDVGIRWREPIRVPETDWGLVPVLVSDRDSVMQVELVSDPETGHLFCFMTFTGDSVAYNWSANFSSDGGATWSETYDWWASYTMSDMGATFVDSHAYVCINRAHSALRRVTMWRFRASDGQRASFPGGQYLEVGEAPSGELPDYCAMASNEEHQGNRVYVAYSRTDDSLRILGYSTADFDTFPFNCLLSDVDNGLDMEWNGLPSANPLVFSYVRADGQVRVYGYDMSMNLEQLYSGNQTSYFPVTSLACHFDTVFVAFTQERSSTRQVRYLIKYGDTTQWFQGGIGDTTPGFSRSVDACGRWADGLAVTYWQYPQNPSGQTFRQRTYRPGQWSPAERVQGSSNTISIRTGSIDRVAPNVYGVVMYRGIANGKAYFNRGDWTGIAERKKGARALPRTLPTVIHGVLEFRGSKPSALVDVAGRKVMSLQPGENDLRHVTPGIYFVRHEEDDLTTKVVIQR
jgi:hypothetical protein